MGLRLAQTESPAVELGLNLCRTEAELAASVLNMDLLRYGLGSWFARGDQFIGVRTLDLGAEPLSIAYTGLQRTYYDSVEGQFETKPMPITGKMLPSEIPHRQLVVGNSLRLKVRYNLELSLYGSCEVSRSGDPNRTDYEVIRESSQTRITKANLPLAIGLIAEERLVNLCPVVFEPVE